MLRRRDWFATLAVVLGLSLLLGACSGSSKPAPAPSEGQKAAAPSGPKSGGTLKVAFAEEPRTFDPLADPGAEGDWVRQQVAEGLIDLNDKGEPVPVLAESFDHPDDLTYIFHLRKNVKFTDGTDFNADAVLFAFNRAMDKSIGAVQWQLYTDHIAKVEATDPLTVKITLKSPWPDFFIILATKSYTDMHSPAAVQKYGKDYGTKYAVGTGPFMLKEWVKGDTIRLVKNPNYWAKGLPYLDGIDYRLIPDESARLMAFKTGQIDIMFNAPYKDAADMKKDAKYAIQSHGAGAAQELWLNTTKPPFNDKRVRQAMDYAIDKQAIAQQVFYGFAEPARSIFPKWHFAHWADGQVHYDPNKAKDLLKQAGYSDSNPLKFTMLTVPVAPYNDQAVIIQSQLAAIGVKADIVTMDKSAMSNKTIALDYQACMYRLVWDPPTMDYSWRPYASTSALNRMGYNMKEKGGALDPKVDTDLNTAITITDQAKAAALFHDIDKAIADDVPKVKIVFADNVNALQGYVKGYQTWVNNVVPFATTWLDK